MHRVVEEASCKVTQMDVHGIGLRLQTVHHIHVRRLGVALEARGYGGDVDEVVRLEDYQFRHADILLHADAHKIELRVLCENLLQVSPVALAVMREISVLRSVTHLHLRSVLLLRYVDIVVVPRVHHHAQHIDVNLAPPCLAVLLWEKPCERLRYAHPAVYRRYEQSRCLDVVWQRRSKVVVRCVVNGVEHLSRVVYENGVLSRNVMLLYDVVKLGEQSDKVDAVQRDGLVDNTLKRIAQNIIAFAYRDVSCSNVLQLVKEGHGTVSGIAFIRVIIQCRNHIDYTWQTYIKKANYTPVL